MFKIHRLCSARRLTGGFVASFAGLALIASPASAASLSWDQAGSGTLGGTGTWDTTTTNWWNGSTDVAWATNTISGDSAVFAGTAGTVTLGTNINALGLTFNTTGYTIAGSTFTLALGTGGIDASALSSGTTTISGGGATGVSLGAASNVERGIGCQPGRFQRCRRLGCAHQKRRWHAHAIGNKYLHGRHNGQRRRACGDGGCQSRSDQLWTHVERRHVENHPDRRFCECGTADHHRAGGGTINVVTTTTQTFQLGNTNTLTGSGNLTITGSGNLSAAATTGTVALNAAQTTFTGNVTTQNGGLLEFNNSLGVSPTSSITLGANGGLTVNNTITLANNVTVSGTGSVLNFGNGNNGLVAGNIALNADSTIGLRDWYNSTPAVAA